MAAAFNWTAALRDLRAEREAAAASSKPAESRRPATRRYAASVPFIIAAEADDDRITPRDVLDASAFERRR